MLLIVSDVNADGRCCPLILSQYKNETDKPVDTFAAFQPLDDSATVSIFDTSAG